MKRSLFDKIWDAHVVEELPGGNALVFMDLVVAHEITTPPGAIAIEKEFGDKLYEPDRIVAMIDHVAPAKDAATALQAQTVRTWAKRQGIRFHDIGNNGICHVLVPERGYVTPGMTRVLRRQPHVHAGRARRVRARDRHDGASRRDARGLSDLAAPEGDAHRDHRRAAARRDGEGPHALGHRDDRLPRRHRLRARVHRLRGSRADHGAAHDAVQHGDRSGRDDGHHRRRRDDASVSRRDAGRAGRLDRAASRRRRGVRGDGDDRRQRHSARRVVGNESRRERAGRRRRAVRRARGVARVHGPAAGPSAAQHRDRSSLHRLVHELAHRRSARGGGRAARPAGQRADDHHAGLASRAPPSRTRGAARHLPRRGRAVDALVVRPVSGHVDGRARGGDALRVVVEPQLSRPHGRRRPRAPRRAGRRRGVGDPRPHRFAVRSMSP